MKLFVDREDELSALEREYKSDRSSLVILYGRRRVGKTALISKFIQDKNALYFLVTEESILQNRNAFKDMAADYTHNSLLKKASVDSWDTIFEAITAQPNDTKKVIVIDEFQYLGKSDSAFPSVFQRIWDTQLQNENIMVILCGSLITMMESQTLSYSSPLYGRRTAQIKLKQIPFRYYTDFYPNKSREEQIEWYSVTGGVPKYIELFEGGQEVYEAIQNNILNQSGFLYEEPTFLLQNEVTEIGSYFSIIKTIAAGNQKLGKIATILEIQQTNLPKYLKTLIDLDILEREVPVTEKNPEKSKRGLYKIKDNFIEFWFKFIYPNRSYIETGNQSLVMNKIKANFVDNHVSFVYEDICRQQMWEMSSQGIWDFPFDKVGRWWDNQNNEIDIVAISEEENIVFGECKYWKDKVGINVLTSLEQKADLVDWNQKKRKKWFVLFSINGFTDELIELSNIRDDIVLSY